MAEALTVADPFALMMNPEAVLRAVEQSDRLGRLQRRICRPLDRPLIPEKGQGRDLDAFDREVDAAADDVGDN
jgi:hypothetical protein